MPHVVLIVGIIIAHILSVLIELLNLSARLGGLPEEFREFCDEKKYQLSQAYQKESTRFHLVEGGILTAVFVAFLFFGGFQWVDHFARQLAGEKGWGEIATGCLFLSVLVFGSQIIKIPFQLYENFVVEEKFGFNRLSFRTFWADWIKGLGLGALLGLPLFAGLVWFFEVYDRSAWVLAWVGFMAFQFLILFLAPAIILPLFNKFAPLEKGELRDAIESYAKSQDFLHQGIYIMDGSKRSSKANAFFTGFGRLRRIVLFDTLLESHSREELITILAHEIGHYKRKHIWKTLGIQSIFSLLIFYLISLLMKNALLFEAFQVETLSTYASILFVFLIYSVLGRFLHFIPNFFSRKFEFEADAFAVQTTGNGKSFIQALKRLSVDHLSHFTPHPLKVWLDYSHPPVLERITAIRSQTMS